MATYWSWLQAVHNGTTKFKDACPHIYSLLRRTGIVNAVHTFYDEHQGAMWDRVKDKEVFSSHRKELEQVYNMLEDSASRCVFENIIRYRLSRKYKYIKNNIDSVENQYIVPEIVFSGTEVIVDCGAYIGDTAEKFLSVAPQGSRVVAFEPNRRSFNQLSRLRPDCIKAYPFATWSEDGVMNFDADEDETSEGISGVLADTGSLKVEVRALDHIPECQDATFIKMDIEGAELATLKGAEQIIKRNRPKLAICIYHKPEDFYEIPFYVRTLHPDYKLYVHHHNSDNTYETVLYAV